MRFLLVEDNQQLATAVKDRLSLDGHVVDRAEDLATADDFIATTEYDLILLDIMLPDGDGRTFLQKHRAAQHPTPVIVLTARSEVSDRVGVLDLGADDYLVKPFSFQELHARIEALLRRPQESEESPSLTCRDLEMDLLTRKVTRNGREITLTPREFQILEFFLRRKNRVVSRTMLLEGVWDYHFDPGTNVIDVHISRLRRKLDDGSDQPLLHTVRGMGYRLGLDG